MGLRWQRYIDGGKPCSGKEPAEPSAPGSTPGNTVLPGHLLDRPSLSDEVARPFLQRFPLGARQPQSVHDRCPLLLRDGILSQPEVVGDLDPMPRFLSRGVPARAHEKRAGGNPPEAHEELQRPLPTRQRHEVVRGRRDSGPIDRDGRGLRHRRLDSKAPRGRPPAGYRKREGGSPSSRGAPSATTAPTRFHSAGPTGPRADLLPGVRSSNDNLVSPR